MTFGWFISGLSASPRRITSSGSNAGVQAGIAVFPEQGVVVAAITRLPCPPSPPTFPK